jgi:hypothetical protein
MRAAFGQGAAVCRFGCSTEFAPDCDRNPTTVIKERPALWSTARLWIVSDSSKVDDGCTCQLLKGSRRYYDVSNNTALTL